MIKLIATDMDGTLLDENSMVPSEFFEILKELNNKNIKFVVASGRPYPTLYENFKPYSDELYYICDNGAYIVDNNKTPIIDIIDKNSVNKMIEVILNIPNTALVLCGTKCAYYTSNNEDFFNEINKYYINKKFVENPFDIDDDIFKVTVCDLGNSAKNSYPILNPLFGSNYKTVVSGEYWLDITNKNVNKGEALKRIQKDYNISFEETMVFGDFYNDVEMLQQAYYSFVMENANDDMKKHGNFVAKSNVEHGVIDAIKNYVLK